MSVYVTAPHLSRAAARYLKVINTVADESSADYSLSRHSMELPLHRGEVCEDRRKFVVRAKVGDILVLVPKVAVKLENRIVTAEVHAKLYEHGRPSFKRMARHGDTVTGEVHWECTKALDLDTLPWLMELYIVDEHIR